MMWYMFLNAGIWGSAFTILLQRVLHEGQAPQKTIKNMKNTGDLRDELRKYHIVPFFKGALPKLSSSFCW